MAVSKDMEEALKWGSLAANQSLDTAQVFVGALYATGTGTPRDLIEAYKWYSLALVNSNKSAVKSMSIIVPKMTDVEITMGKLRAASFSAKHGTE
jgi:TPR repeat protein